MKKLIRSMMFAAAAVAAFNSCSKDTTVDGPGSNTRKTKLHIVAVTDETQSRTEFGDKYAIKWIDDDEIGVYIDGSGTATGNGYGFAGRDPDTKMVSFMAEVSAGYASGDKLYAYYPYSADNAGSPSAVALVIPATQEQTAVKKFNGAYNPLVSVPQAIDATTDEAALTIKFRQTAAMGEFGIKSATYAGEKIISLSFTADKNLVGEFNYDLTAITETGQMPVITPQVGAGKAVTVSLPETSTAVTAAEVGDNLLFFSVIPGTYTGDFVVTTDKATYTLTDRTIEFPRAYVKRYTVDLDKATRLMTTKVYKKISATPTDWTGNYLIVYENSGSANVFNSALSSPDAANNFITTAITDGAIESITATDACVVNVSAMSGGYSIKCANGKYLSGSNGSLNTVTSPVAQTLTYTSGNVEVKQGTAYLKYNTSGNRFRYYTSGQASITFYKQTYAIAVPEIIVEKTDIKIAPDETSGSISFTPKYLSGNVTATVTNAVDNWLSATAGADKVNWTASVNEGAERTATLTLTASGAEPVVITITQVAAGTIPAIPASITSFSAINGQIDSKISYASFKGGAGTAPAIFNNGIRLYQGSTGGYITITAASGYKLQSATITTTPTYDTDVQTKVDNGALSGKTAVAKSSSFTVDGQTAQSISFYCAGTTSSTRLEIGAISVTYIPE